MVGAAKTPLRLRLLIVEDDSAFARLLRRRLRGSEDRFEVEQVETVRAAREAVERAVPDLVLLDLVLPDGRGLDLVQPLDKARYAVIVLSAHGDESAAVEAMRAGALDFLTKSASVLEHLVPILERTAQRWQELQAQRRLEQAQKVLERQLLQAQKSDALGLLAGGIAHDFSNILTAIAGFTNSALVELNAGSQAAQDLQQVLVASERARGLVERVLAFTRQEAQERRPEELRTVVQEVIGLLLPPLPAGVRVEQHLSTDQDQVLAAPVQLHQIVLNLFTNACQALAEQGGCVQVETTVVEGAFLGSLSRSLSGKPLPAASYLRLSVTDDGPGMDAETLRQIFHPFFTTRKSSDRRGAGLGLAVVKNLVEDLGGALRVESTPGHGTRFDIFLPRWREPRDSSGIEDLEHQRPRPRASERATAGRTPAEETHAAHHSTPVGA